MSIGSYLHKFEFVPVSRRLGGWSVDDGEPRIWWRARLDTTLPILLSDGRNARELEAHVSISIGAETSVGKTLYTGEGGPAAKWGFINVLPGARAIHSDMLYVVVAVSSENFERILGSIRNGTPPTLSAAFGPEDAFTALEEPITVNHSPFGYRWDITGKRPVAIEACEFACSSIPVPTEVPELPEQPNRIARVTGTSFMVIAHILAVLVALAMFNAAHSKFETATVSLLLLVYLELVNSRGNVARLIAHVDLSSINRFFHLRTIAGFPPQREETQFLEAMRNRLERLGGEYWVRVITSTVVSLLVAYQLGRLLLSLD